MCIEPPRPWRAAVDAAEQLGHHVLGRRAARERVAVRAVGRDQVVAVAQRPRAADDRRLLADREVQEAADLRPRVHLAGALLEAADQRHRLQPLARRSGAGRARGGVACHQRLHRYSSGARNSSALEARRGPARSAPRRACEAACGGRSQSTIDFAAVDLDDLDVVDALGVGEQRRARARRASRSGGRRGGPHARLVAARSPQRRVRRAPLERALAVEHPLADDARPGRRARPRRAACAVRRVELLGDRAHARRPCSTAAGCISQAAAAISTLSSSSSARPPANAWRKAACANGTARPIDFA